jgi:hypothetical protein
MQKGFYLEFEVEALFVHPHVHPGAIYGRSEAN